MPNSEGNPVGANQALHWWLYSEFSQRLNANPTGVPFLQMIPGVNPVDNQPPGVAPNDIDLDLLDTIGCYKLWQVAGWDMQFIWPTDGPAPLVCGAYDTYHLSVNPGGVVAGIGANGWGGGDAGECGDIALEYLVPSNLYAVSIRLPWMKYAASDPCDYVMVVFQSADGATFARLWAEAFTQRSCDHAPMEMESQIEVPPAETQPPAMNYPMWRQDIT